MSTHQTERDALTALIEDASAAMLEKLIAKADQGRRGWNDPNQMLGIRANLLTHVSRAIDDPEQWLDVANLAVMLWRGSLSSDKD